MSVTQKFTGDTSQLMKEYDKILASQAKLEQKLADSTNAQKLAAKQAVDASRSQMSMEKNRQDLVASSLAGLAGMATGYLSIQTAMAGVTAEMRMQDQLRKESLKQSLDLAGAQAGVIKNLGNVPTSEAQKFLGDINAIAERTNVSARDLAMAAGTALSSAQGDQAKTLRMLEAAAPIFRDAPGDLPEFVQRIPAFQKSMGGTESEAIERLVALQGTARIVSLTGLGNAAPAVSGSAIYQGGADKNEASISSAAVFAALGSALDDSEGAESKTATLKLSRILEDVTGISGRGKTSLDRIAMIQADPQMQAAALKAYGNEVSTGAVRSLLSDPAGDVAGSLKTAADALRNSKGGYQQLLANLQGGSAPLKVAEFDQASEQNRRNMLSDPRKALEAQRMQVFSEAIDSQTDWSTLGFTKRAAKAAVWMKPDSAATELRENWMPSNDPAGQKYMADQIALLQRIEAELAKLNLQQPGKKTGNAAMQSNMQAERN
jgi:hypothetical protein